MSVATGRQNRASAFGVIRRCGKQAFLPRLFVALALLGALALCPAGVQAQNIDAWLLGYRFDCCPGRTGVEGQYLSLALFVNPIAESTGGGGVFAKYYVSESRMSPEHGFPQITAMRDAILGGPYVQGSSIVRDFQRAVGVPSDGVWGDETWRAVFAYFDRLAGPRTLFLGNRRIRFLPLHHMELSSGQSLSLSSRLRNDILFQNVMDLNVFKPLLIAGPDPSASGIYEIGPSALTLIQAIPGHRQESVRQAFEVLTPEQQSVLADAAKSLLAPARYSLTASSSRLVEAAGENAPALKSALAALTPEQQRAVGKLAQTLENSSPGQLQRTSREFEDLQASVQAERAKHEELIKQLDGISDDLKARLREAGINPDGAFDSAKKNDLWESLVQLWDDFEDKAWITVVPAYVVAGLTIFVLIFALVDIQKSDKEYRAKISGPGQHAGAGAYAAPVGSSDKLTSLAPSSGRLLVHRLQEQPSALDAASAALERQREKIEEALTLLKQAIPRQEEGGLKNSVTELNERLDELARKLDEISDGTIKNYVGEILNRLDK